MFEENEHTERGRMKRKWGENWQHLPWARAKKTQVFSISNLISALNFVMEDSFNDTKVLIGIIFTFKYKRANKLELSCVKDRRSWG